MHPVGAMAISGYGRPLCSLLCFQHACKSVFCSLLPLHKGPRFCTPDESLPAQFARLNQIYRERQKQLAAGVDVLKEEYGK